MNVYRNTIRNSQKIDEQSRYLSMDEWRNNVVYTRSGILFSHKEELNTDTCYNVDES